MAIIMIFSLALSIDLFAFALGYGFAKTVISPQKCGIITLICAVLLAAGLALRSVIAPLVPSHILSILSSLVLAVIGFSKILQKSGDGGEVKPLSYKETFIVGAAVSFDGFIGGVASAFVPAEYFLLFTVFITMSAIAVVGGNLLGLNKANLTKFHLGKTAGIALLIVAAARLFA
jgi:putative Mn2+ efflux pump MntP